MIFQVGAWACAWGSNEYASLLGTLGEPRIIVYTADVVDGKESTKTFDRYTTFWSWRA